MDLASKHIFYNLGYFRESIYVKAVLNTGVSWSIPLPFIVIIAVSVIGIGAIILLYKKKHIGEWITGLLLAGTIGNLIDRVIYSGVRDFIDIRLFNFPIFNIADMLLTLGVGLRMLQVILEKKK